MTALRCHTAFTLGCKSCKKHLILQRFLQLRLQNDHKIPQLRPTYHAPDRDIFLLYNHATNSSVAFATWVAKPVNTRVPGRNICCGTMVAHDNTLFTLFIQSNCAKTDM